MSYTGGGPYYAQQYPEYNGILWNGRCGNPECIYHWHPPEAVSYTHLTLPTKLEV